MFSANVAKGNERGFRVQTRVIQLLCESGGKIFESWAWARFKPLANKYASKYAKKKKKDAQHKFQSWVSLDSTHFPNSQNDIYQESQNKTLQQ